jgi:hypothetical protein
MLRWPIRPMGLLLDTDLKVGHRNMKRASTDRQESLRFETGKLGFTSFFYVCRCRSTRVGAGESGIKCKSTRVETDQNNVLWGLHSGNAITNSRVSNWLHMKLKPYRPSSTLIDPYRNTCQSLMDSGSRIRRRKKVLVMFKIFTWISIPYWYPYWHRSNRIDPHQPAV